MDRLKDRNNIIEHYDEVIKLLIETTSIMKLLLRFIGRKITFANIGRTRKIRPVGSICATPTLTTIIM